jgi:hypothetical protein
LAQYTIRSDKDCVPSQILKEDQQMQKEWKLKKKDGPISGELLDGCEIRRNEDGTIDFLGVLAKATQDGAHYRFPEFAYQGLIWNIGINSFSYGRDGNEVEGKWRNNLTPAIVDEEGGTYTGQASSGGGMEEGKSGDAASASA